LTTKKVKKSNINEFIFPSGVFDIHTANLSQINQ
jgi:hypothetical protein